MTPQRQAIKLWLVALATAVAVLTAGPVLAQQLPRENVIDVPAVSEGLCTHNLFQSHMVLQRDNPIRVWGYAAPGENVTVTFAGQTASAQAGADRRWLVALPEALAANSEGRTMTITAGNETLSYEDILVGDVWVLGGQSNMEHPISRVENGQLEIASANFPQIRILTVPFSEGPQPTTDFPRLMEWSDFFRQHYRKGYWDVCTPETVQELSGIGYIFARRLFMATQIPIGVVDASRGGTNIETWIPDPALRQSGSTHIDAVMAEWDRKIARWDAEADLANRIRQHEQYIASMNERNQEIPADRREAPTDLRPGPGKDYNRPSNCYYGILNTLTGLPVAGVIFHQGYSNCGNGTEGARMYRDAMPLMINAWRQTFQDDDMPFCIISLCTDNVMQTRDTFAQSMLNAGPFIREAQHQTYLQYRAAGDMNIGFASTYDLNRNWYHPALKIPAGERAARWALNTQYGMNRIQWQPPALQEMTVENGRIILRYDRNVMPVATGLPLEGFAISGADRRFYPANVDNLVTGQDGQGRDQYDRNVLVLSNPMVAEPVAYRYAWARSPMGNAQVGGNSDIPLPTQRSDDWPMEAVPLGVFEDGPPAQLDRSQSNTLLQVLQQIDLDRRRAEARLLLEEDPGN